MPVPVGMAVVLMRLPAVIARRTTAAPVAPPTGPSYLSLSLSSSSSSSSIITTSLHRRGHKGTGIRVVGYERFGPASVECDRCHRRWPALLMKSWPCRGPGKEGANRKKKKNGENHRSKLRCCSRAGARGRWGRPREGRCGSASCGRPRPAFPHTAHNTTTSTNPTSLIWTAAHSHKKKQQCPIRSAVRVARAQLLHTLHKTPQAANPTISIIHMPTRDHHYGETNSGRIQGLPRGVTPPQRPRAGLACPTCSATRYNKPNGPIITKYKNLMIIV
jgi:hypothetical protein